VTRAACDELWADNDVQLVRAVLAAHGRDEPAVWDDLIARAHALVRESRGAIKRTAAALMAAPDGRIDGETLRRLAAEGVHYG
jgi:hypothetical protein